MVCATQLIKCITRKNKAPVKLGPLSITLLDCCGRKWWTKKMASDIDLPMNFQNKVYLRETEATNHYSIQETFLCA